MLDNPHHSHRRSLEVEYDDDDDLAGYNLSSRRLHVMDGPGACEDNLQPRRSQRQRRNSIAKADWKHKVLSEVGGANQVDDDEEEEVVSSAKAIGAKGELDV